MLIELRARVHAHALSGAALFGATVGVLLGGAFVAGGAARASATHDRANRQTAVAAAGFSDSVLKAETDAMDPGAAALARRFDPQGDDDAAGRGRNPFQPARLAADLPAPAWRAGTADPTSQVFRLPAENALESARELDCLTDAVYYEARGESSDGQAAVAQVVMNRVRKPGYPKSVCGVVYQGAQSHVCQFSFACDGAIYKAREAGAWRRAQTVAARALGGFVMAQVGDATHFHVARLGAIWGGDLIRVAQVGAHVFYRITSHGGLSAHEWHANEDADDDADDADAIPADGGQPTLILASAVSAKPDPASAVTATATAAAPDKSATAPETSAAPKAQS